MNDATKDALTSNRLCGMLHLLGTEQVQALLNQQVSGRTKWRVSNLHLLWVIVGFGLFAGKSYRNLFRLTTGGITPPTRAAICAARKRLSAETLQQIHDAVVGWIATPKKCPRAFYKGLRLVGIDGTLLDCFDSDANRGHFHRPTNQSGHGAFPKLRLVALCELGTRVLYRSVIGTYHDCERVLADRLLRHLSPKCLLLGDRHFGVAPIICRLIDDEVPFLIRVKKGHVFPVEKQLADGSYLSTIYLGKNDRVCKRPGKRVRVIRYTFDDPARSGHGEEHVLVTSLLCPKRYPAKELICLYHERWEEEIAFGEMKQTLHGGRVLRSQSPEMTRQEIWGLLLAHFVIRKLAYRAAIKNKVEPSRISFTATINVVHLQLAEAPSGRGPQSRLMKQWLAVTIDAIRLELLPPRRQRINPRVVKKRSVARKTKHDHHRKPPPPHPDFAATIKIPI
jgi:hypothetical protein